MNSCPTHRFQLEILGYPCAKEKGDYIKNELLNLSLNRKLPIGLDILRGNLLNSTEEKMK